MTAVGLLLHAGSHIDAQNYVSAESMHLALRVVVAALGWQATHMTVVG